MPDNYCLGLLEGDSEFPFMNIPSQNRTLHWAGRKKEKNKIDRLVRRWGMRRNSSITVLWGVWGQGKTHTLKYLQTMAESEEDRICHYVTLPSIAGAGGSPFASLYRQIMLNFPLETLGKKVVERYKHNIRQIFGHGNGPPSHLYQLLWIIGSNSRGSNIARLWFQGDNVVKKDLDELIIADTHLNVPSRPRNAQDCLNTFKGLLQIMKVLSDGSKDNFVLFIDEFQKVGELPPRQIRDICDNLNMLYNENPEDFHMILSFATGDAVAVEAILSQDLRSRTRTRIDLPYPDINESKEYIEDLLSSYHGENTSSPFCPFSVESIDAILQYAFKNTDPVTLRKLNDIFAIILEEALINIEEENHIEEFLVKVSEVNEIIQTNTSEIISVLNAQE